MSEPRSVFGQVRAAQSYREIGCGRQGGDSDGEPTLDEELVDPISHCPPSDETRRRPDAGADSAHRRDEKAASMIAVCRRSPATSELPCLIDARTKIEP
jgi:hypothetical protein